MKSYDAPSSPELGRTKDTSAFSAIKFINKMNTYYNSSTGIKSNNINKLITNPKLHLKRTVSKQDSESNEFSMRDQSNKAKYLTKS